MGTYEFMKKHFGPVLDKVYNISVRGKENIPKGKAILAANHASFLDPFLICHIIDRKIHFMVKNSFDIFPYNLFLKTSEQIFISENPKAYLKKAIYFLRNEELIGIFPEGARTDDGQLSEGKKGVANLSYSSNSPVIPIAIAGTYSAFPRGALFPKFNKNIEIIIGEPINFWKYNSKTRENSEIFLKIVMDEISKLKNQLPYL